jgi:hypothetical protein
MGTKWSLLWKRLRSTLKWVLPTRLRRYGLRPSGKTKGSTLKWVLPTRLRRYGLRPSGKTKGSTLTIPDLRYKLLYG